MVSHQAIIWNQCLLLIIKWIDFDENNHQNNLLSLILPAFCLGGRLYETVMSWENLMDDYLMMWDAGNIGIHNALFF